MLIGISVMARKREACLLIENSKKRIDEGTKFLLPKKNSYCVSAHIVEFFLFFSSSFLFLFLFVF